MVWPYLGTRRGVRRREHWGPIERLNLPEFAVGSEVLLERLLLQEGRQLTSWQHERLSRERRRLQADGLGL